MLRKIAKSKNKLEEIVIIPTLPQTTPELDEKSGIYTLPAEMLLEIFKRVPVSQLPLLKLVCKSWNAIIAEEYNDTLYGEMFHFFKYASDPITNTIKDLNQLQKSLHITAYSYARDNRGLWLPIFYFGALGVCSFIMFLSSRIPTLKKDFNKVNDDIKKIMAIFPGPIKNLMMFLIGNPEIILLIVLSVSMGYFLYTQFRDYQNMQQVVNHNVYTNVSTFFAGDSGKLATQLLYDNVSNDEYPPLEQNPAMTNFELKMSIEQDKQALKEVNEGLQDSLKSLHFTKKNKFKIEDLKFNSKVTDYLKVQYASWARLNAKASLDNGKEEKLENDSAPSLLFNLQG